MANYAYKALKQPKNVGSGVSESIFWAPIYAFATDGIKCPTPNETTPVPGDQITVSEDHTFGTGEGFIEFLCAPEKNKLDAKTIGEKGSQKLEETLTVFFPGSYAEVHEAVKNMLNQPGIALIKDANCAADLWYQLGCDCLYAWWTFDFTTSTTKDGVKGYTGTLTYTTDGVLLYSGVVTKKP